MTETKPFEQAVREYMDQIGVPAHLFPQYVELVFYQAKEDYSRLYGMDSYVKDYFFSDRITHNQQINRSLTKVYQSMKTTEAGQQSIEAARQSGFHGIAVSIFRILSDEKTLTVGPSTDPELNDKLKWLTRLIKAS